MSFYKSAAYILLISESPWSLDGCAGRGQGAWVSLARTKACLGTAAGAPSVSRHGWRPSGSAVLKSRSSTGASSPLGGYDVTRLLHAPAPRRSGSKAELDGGKGTRVVAPA